MTLSISPVKSNSIEILDQSTHLKVFQNIALGPYKLVMAIWTTANMLRHPENPITTQAPSIQKHIENVVCWMGMYPAGPYIQELHLLASPIQTTFPYLKIPVNTSHLLQDAELSAKVLVYHRMGDDFDGSSASDEFFKLLKTVFPDENFCENDAILSCNPDFSKIHRGNFVHALRIKKINEIVPDQVNKLIKRWKIYAENQEEFDIRNETNRFTTDVLTTTIFGQSNDFEEICETIHFMSTYIFKKFTRQATTKHCEQFKVHCARFRETVYAILNHEFEQPIPLFETTPNSTKTQKIANIFTAFFGGQETTSFAATRLIAQVALHPEITTNLLNSVIEEPNLLKNQVIMQFIAESLLDASPVNGIAKRLKKDKKIFFKNEEGQIFSKYLQKGEKIISIISGVSNNLLAIHKDKITPQQLIEKANIFGKGVNRCVGQMLAMKELADLLIAIISNFKLTTNESEFKYTTELTKTADSFYIKLKNN